jgi:Family of unknown function (DUF6152)
MKRREFTKVLAASTCLTATKQVFAHHGWSSFDETRPLYLAGKVATIKWQNPHAELTLQLSSPLTLPNELSKLKIPAQTANVDANKIFANASLPKHRGIWNVELAPLTRMQAWKIEPLKVGDSIAVIVFTYKDEVGAKVARAEFLIVDTAVYGLRSAPQS